MFLRKVPVFFDLVLKMVDDNNADFQDLTRETDDIRVDVYEQLYYIPVGREDIIQNICL